LALPLVEFAKHGEPLETPCGCSHGHRQQ
jgi:hypothetical protein